MQLGPLGEVLADRLESIAARFDELPDLHRARESDLVVFSLIAAAGALDRSGDPELHREVAAGIQDVWHSEKKRSVGAWDLATRQGGRIVEAVEAKWIATDKVHELLWDALKLGVAVQRGVVQQGYLLFGIQAAQRDLAQGRGRPAELWESGDHETATLLRVHAQSWKWCMGSAARPYGGLPERLRTEPVRVAAIRGGDYELRLVQVSGTGWVETDADGMAIVS